MRVIDNRQAHVISTLEMTRRRKCQAALERRIRLCLKRACSELKCGENYGPLSRKSDETQMIVRIRKDVAIQKKSN